jgi:hypothetical protein
MKAGERMPPGMGELTASMVRINFLKQSMDQRKVQFLQDHINQQVEASQRITPVVSAI